MYPTQNEHLPTDYESLNNSPSTRVDIEGCAKNTVDSRPLDTVLIDVAEQSTIDSNSRTKVLS